jgi:phage gp36-like protein
MPIYASYNDLVQFFSSANITDWADKDRTGSLSTEELAHIDSGIEASEGMIDSYLQKGGYAAPYDTLRFNQLPTQVKSLIRQWTVIITGFYLYAWRGIRDKVNPLEALYTQTLKQLSEIAKGAPLSGMEKEVQVRFGTGTSDDSPTDSLQHMNADAWDW